MNVRIHKTVKLLIEEQQISNYEINLILYEKLKYKKVKEWRKK